VKVRGAMKCVYIYTKSKVYTINDGCTKHGRNIQKASLKLGHKKTICHLDEKFEV